MSKSFFNLGLFLFLGLFASNIMAYAHMPAYINPSEKKLNLYFENQQTQNDVRVGYSLSSRLNPQFQFVRNHRKEFIELHYVYVRTNVLVFESASEVVPESSRWSLSLLPGAGVANKLSGFNRFSYTFGYFADFQTENIYFEQSTFGYFAKDFDDKISILARGGGLIEKTTDGLHFWFLMQALRETYHSHNIAWGPVFRISASRFYFDLYGTVKGDIGLTLNVGY